MKGMQNTSDIEAALLVKDDAFLYYEAPKGDTVLIGLNDDDYIVFIMSGEVQISNTKSSKVILKSNHMYSFSAKRCPYSGHVLSDAKIISLKTSSLRPYVSAIRLQSLFNLKCPIREEFTYLEFGPLLFSYLEGVKFLKNNGIYTGAIYDVKRLEFLYYLKELYTEDKLAYFFNETLSKYTNFKILVYSKYTNSLTVKELAEDCFMTTRTFSRRFKAEFGLPPHKWLIGQKIKNLNDLILNKGTDVDSILGMFGFSSKNEFKQFCVRYNLYNILDALKEVKNQ